MDAKFQRLTQLLGESERLLVAFSAGVDSTFLLKAAHMAIGARAIALTAASPTVPPGELDAAKISLKVSVAATSFSTLMN